MARRSIDITSFQHGNPIPAATRIGPLVVCSITPPTDPGTRNIPDTLEAQIDNLFTHVGNMLEGAGATWDDVAKMTFYVADPAKSREALNGPWLERFPDPASRPSRHNMQVVDTGGKAQISCDFIAYVES
ncbi:MAG: RidA family protein [Actinomycetota bacterium]|nr:RidA family protein [Actinomycetota bacterium]